MIVDFSCLKSPEVYAIDLVNLGISQADYKACKWYGQMTENYNAQVLAEMQRLEKQQEKAA